MSNVPTPPNSIKTTAIALLFKDGFSIEDLADIFTPLRPFDIEEHVRRAMFNGQRSVVKPTDMLDIALTDKPPKKAKPVAATPPALRRPLHKFFVESGVAASKPKAGKSSRRKVCSHVDPERDKHGTCKLCKKEYMQAYWAKRKSPKKQTLKQNEVNRPSLPVELPIDSVDDIDEIDAELDEDLETPVPAEAPAAAAGEFVYSKPFTCPKCGDRGVRLRRRHDANLSVDYWLHVKPNGTAPCMLKIINYTIKDDKGYRP